MTTRYTKNSTTALAVASLLNMAPTTGTSNMLNDMLREGEITTDMNFGQIAFAYLAHAQDKLQRQLLFTEVDWTADGEGNDIDTIDD